MRVYYYAFRYLFGYRMMIGYDYPHAVLNSKRHLGVRGNAAIHGKQNPVFFRNTAYGIGIQPVSFGMPIGNIIINIRLKMAKHKKHNGNCAYAVHIVVAVHRYMLVSIYCLKQRIRRLFYSRQALRQM